MGSVHTREPSWHPGDYKVPTGATPRARQCSDQDGGLPWWPGQGPCTLCFQALGKRPEWLGVKAGTCYGRDNVRASQAREE